ncbi:PEP-CTERM sorting domain-containing protein [Thiohalocapsa marina]|uniref:PEP-CTERM sorting domain-containing protein n=1 Tax=Thiohalocapsa marina TaxID=424902 RepID=UPI00147923AD|nr:PEP-CTERM sorting domain-containing protein [Thiohalocapsa marina]
MLGLLFLSLLLFGGTAAAAVSTTDWGTIATPIEDDVTFQFAQNDIDSNFTDQYQFSLEGDAGASYAITFNTDTCDSGCGNPDYEYGIYDSSGQLVEPVDGVYYVSGGDYTFQVKGTGMGSGNTVDYSGSITFSAVAGTKVVSAVPEPPIPVLLLSGLAAITLLTRRRRHSERPHARTDE